MKPETENKLDALVNNHYNYQGKDVKITRWKEVSGTNIVIFLDDRPRNILHHELESFIAELKPPKEQHPKTPARREKQNELAAYTPTAENKQVKTALLDTLEKLKTDATYIPQAQAICKVVGQIVNVQKTEIQMYNAIKNNQQ